MVLFKTRNKSSNFCTHTIIHFIHINYNSHNIKKNNELKKLNDQLSSYIYALKYNQYNKQKNFTLHKL